MIGSRRSWTLGLLAGLLAVTMVFPSYAAKRSPIKSITFSIKAHIVPDTEFGEEEIEFETSSSRFSIDDYEILNEDFMWNEDSVPRLRVTMTADEDYYFPALSKDKIKIKGGAEFVKATRQDSNSVLLMEIRLPSLDMTLRDLENVTLSADGTASWDAIAAAGSYEVRVYRDNKAVGAAMETKTNHLNCREKMTKGNASYTVKVRPVNKHDASEKGEWIESSGIYIDESQAAQFRDNPAGSAGVWLQSPDNGRWWYSISEGVYPANGWYEIGDKWYFFDGEGYMQTGWILWDGKEYYCTENGDMLSNCMTPDNYWVGEDGAKIAQ